jgi:hypothetical protein
MDKFTEAYVECALWSTNDESDPQGGDPLDKNYSVEDINPDTLAWMEADCKRFQEENATDIVGREEQAGHDFWLSRNHHGAGFFDGKWGAVGDILQERAEAYGEVCLYVEDGKIMYE